MSSHVLTQATSLGEGFVLGLVIGVSYDLLHVVRTRGLPPLLAHVLDLLFWIFATGLLFFWSQGAWEGEIRLYGVVSILVGAILYFYTFTGITLGLGYLLADVFQLFLDILVMPLHLACTLEKKFKKFAKNLFLFWWKWYKIESMTGELDKQTFRQEQKGEKENAHYSSERVDKMRGGSDTHLFRSQSFKRGNRNSRDSIGERSAGDGSSRHGRE